MYDGVMIVLVLTSVSLLIYEFRHEPGPRADGFEACVVSVFVTEYLLGVVEMERGKELIFSTRGIDHKLDRNDVLVVIGPRRELDAFSELIDRKTPRPGE
ncbi:MAG: hypothetical protein ACYCZA_03475 [Thiobacillus sp.]